MTEPSDDRTGRRPRGLPTDVARLRARASREAGLVVLGTVLLVLAELRWDLVAGLAPPGSLAGLALVVLAVSHVLMLVFGARRARELVRAYAERQLAHAELERRATHDAVTGLPDRERLAERLADSLAAGGPTALVRLRLRSLEQVTATLGHDVRDGVLAAVARRLQQDLASGAGPGAVVTSVQSEEFAVLLPGTDEAAARPVVARLLACVGEPVAVGPGELEVDAVAGLAVSEPGVGPAELLGRAEVALQAASGTGGLRAYRPALDRRDASRLNLHGELRRGIAAGELVLHHQPTVELRSGRVTGVEALVRWQHPTRGLLPPAAFLGVAEQTGLVGPLTEAVLDQALADQAAWSAAGAHLRVAVNLSARSLVDDSLPDLVRAVLARHGSDPAGLELEVTESLAVQDPDTAVAVLQTLRETGVGVALDDFGTGHSSLAVLGRLPITTLKVDRSFVMAMGSSARDLTIVRSTVDLGHGLGHRVVAEGVETADAWRWLHTLGCDEAQGFWMARPVVATQVLASVAAVEERLAVLPTGST